MGPPRRFKDPTNDVTGLSRYLVALTILFEAPPLSKVGLPVRRGGCGEGSPACLASSLPFRRAWGLPLSHLSPSLGASTPAVLLLPVTGAHT